jgi:radical SAM superfamily enzyme YgiQ (UPF0313 family)
MQKPLGILLAAVNLEDGAEAVPLGAASVAAALKAAFPAGRLSLSLVECFVADGPGALVRKLTGGDAGAIGFSLYSWNRDLILEAAGILRGRRRGIFLFCGGPEAGARPGGLGLAEGGPFDAVIRGEGEGAAVELLGQRFFRAPAGLGAGLQANPPSPWLDGTLRVRGRKGALWELARGCPYSCAYCYESKGSAGFGQIGTSPGGGETQKRVRYFPEERLREELRLFVREGVPYVFVLDPTFNTDNRRALDMLDMINRESRGAGIHWHFEARAELLTGEQARSFAALGASVQIGLQTADPRVSSLVGRPFDRGRFTAGLGRLNRAGVIFGLDLIYGLPGDSLAGFRRSLDFALSLYPNHLDLFRLAVLPGTVLADQVEGLALEVNPEAPYELRASAQFPREDLARAERLSEAADLFYNQGRAVAWFNQVLYYLGLKPSAFLEGFADYLDGGTYPGSNKGPFSRPGPEEGSADIEKLQLAYLSSRCKKAKKEALLPAIRELVRFHGAWGRSLTGNYSPQEGLL